MQQQRQILDMFEWNDSDDYYLNNMILDNGAGGTIQDKRFKHLCYLFETYAVAIKPDDNITQNPGCEWQLRLYQKSSE